MSSDAGRIFVGVDGGGSGCRAVAALADGTRLADARGGPANAFDDPERAGRVVLALLQRLATEAGLGPGDLPAARVHVGLAGVVDESRAARVRAVLGLDRVRVTDDRPTALVGALGGRDGCLAAIGTGSFVGVRSEGTTRFFGGWGMHVSDEASGAWIGRAILRRCVAVHDGLTRSSDLIETVRGEIGGGVVEIAAFAASARPAAWAALAPLVVEGARSKNPHALAIMRAGAAWIVRCTRAADPRGRLPLVLTGGLGPSYAPYLPQPIRDRLASPEGSPLDGALALAMSAGRTA